jgi:HD domain
MLVVPDSRLAVAAVDLATAHMPHWLLAHSYRTFHFGAALLEIAGRPTDAELLFVGSMLHDIALGTDLDRDDMPFEVIGARVAEEFMTRFGANAARSRAVAEAIELHLQLSTADDERPEVAGVHLGAAVDVIGLRSGDLTQDVLTAALATHPRGTFVDELVQAMQAEARKQNSTIAELIRTFGFLEMIKTCPLH